MGRGAGQPRNRTFILHIALGGCLHGGKIDFGITEDTGGHISYVLGAARAQAQRCDVGRVDIVTRGFIDTNLGDIHAEPRESFCEKGAIYRLFSTRTDYLEKSDLDAELPSLKVAFLDLLGHIKLPDVIHAHFGDGAALAQAAEQRFGISWVYTSHSLGLDKQRAEQGARIERERAAITGAGAIIASSRDEAERQIEAYSTTAAGRVHHVRPGVSLSPDPGTGPALDLITPMLDAPEKPVLLAVARPVRKKNLTGLVRAYAESDTLRTNTNLVILSGQHDRLASSKSEAAEVISDLRRLFARYNLKGQVALPAAHRPEHVRSLYALAATAGVFVNVAFVEPFGLTTVEALQAGCPVVATRHGAPPGILAKVDHGLIVDPYDGGAIAAACLEMVYDPRRAERAGTARGRARTIFDWVKWVERTNQIYQGLSRPAAPHATIDRLIVSDIDGTLTGDVAAARKVTAFLGQFRRTGFIVATGRSISEARRVLADWGLPEPDTIIASVGTEIWNHRGQGAYELDESYVARLSTEWNADSIQYVTNQTELTPQPAHDQRRWKISLFGSNSDADRLGDALTQDRLAVRVIASHGNLIDIVPATAGKAAAMAHVAARHGLGPGACIACGDSANDADMLGAAGVAILPANARREIDHITGPQVFRMSEPYAAGVLSGLRLLLQPSVPAVLAAQ